jgi:hypothetical protein
MPGAVAFALAGRHQVALGVDRDVAAAVVRRAGELGQVLALAAAPQVSTRIICRR